MSLAVCCLGGDEASRSRDLALTRVISKSDPASCLVMIPTLCGLVPLLKRRKNPQTDQDEDEGKVSTRPWEAVNDDAAGRFLSDLVFSLFIPQTLTKMLDLVGALRG